MTKTWLWKWLDRRSRTRKPTGARPRRRVRLGVETLEDRTVPAVDLILNGGFETSNFANWTVINTGSGNWSINNGTLVSPGDGTTRPPIAGSFDAITVQRGPREH